MPMIMQMMLSLATVLLALSYLVTVGLTWCVQWLVNATFGTAFDFNVWLLGGLSWIVLFILKQIFGDK